MMNGPRSSGLQSRRTMIELCRKFTVDGSFVIVLKAKIDTELKKQLLVIRFCPESLPEHATMEFNKKYLEPEEAKIDQPLTTKTQGRLNHIGELGDRLGRQGPRGAKQGRLGAAAWADVKNKVN
ncbi:unnamed protein product [Nesidiocoris tenuis]|uniref:Uncharacterized protein n=1 Tax=Nesidiocoris tenuis TaxID=355587 RepID=A0A6H5H1D5_9HEMI|nr:unnamed protein product [Nesidiocoris tenuis]